MLLQLKPLFMGEQDSLPIDCKMDFSGLEFQNIRPFRQPVQVSGKVTVTADIVMLRAAASFLYEGECDRCLAGFTRSMEVPIEHVLVASLNNEDNDEFVLVENYQLSLDDLVREDLILALPTKNLCREDCCGLCPKCGKNLNEGPCGCRSETVDPRLESLRNLIP